MSDRRFPIQDGPSVPWSAMVPFERQAMKNHSGQSLEKLAERCGLGAGEAMLVVTGRDLDFRLSKEGWEQLRQDWFKWAEGVNHDREIAAAVEAFKARACRAVKPFEPDGADEIERAIRTIPTDRTALAAHDAQVRLEEAETFHKLWEESVSVVPKHKAYELPEFCLICKRLATLRGEAEGGTKP